MDLHPALEVVSRKLVEPHPASKTQRRHRWLLLHLRIDDQHVLVKHCRLASRIARAILGVTRQFVENELDLEFLLHVAFCLFDGVRVNHVHVHAALQLVAHLAQL